MEISIRTKKFIAREFIFFIAVIIIGVAAFPSTYIYNNNLESKIQKIASDIKFKEKISDSLSSIYALKNEKQKWFYVEYRKSYNAVNTSDLEYTQDQLWLGLTRAAEDNNIRYKWKNWDSKITSPFAELKLSTPEALQKFLLDNEFVGIDTINHNKSLNIIQEIRAFKEREREVNSQKLSFKNQIRFGINSSLIAALILFVFRYLIYGMLWSVKTLKSK